VPDTLVTRAILLRAVATGESDRVVTLLGRETGRISAIARGARKSVRRFSGGLGLAATGEAVLRDRPGADLLLLESFEVLRGRHGLGADLARTAHAGYVAELAGELTAPRQPEVEIYDWVETFLDALDERGAHVARLRTFELGLLARLGLGSDFGRCVACGRVDLGDLMVRLEVERGGVTCPGCARRGTPLHPPVRRALAQLSALSIEQSEAVELSRDDAAACRTAVAELLAPHLSRPLKSLEFLRKLQNA
jgi:DNA repair protein RecO (recombination protein O)